MMNKHSGRPRGFGFVTFTDSAVADEVLAQEHTIDGRVVSCRSAYVSSNSLVHILSLIAMSVFFSFLFRLKSRGQFLGKTWKG